MGSISLKRLSATALMVLASACAMSAPASADIPGAHPAFIHGLKDLRVAHRLLDHPGNANENAQEVQALRNVDLAYHYAVAAAERDRKDIHAYEPIDANLRHRDRLVRAIAALEAAHRDFTRYESNGAAIGWRHDAVVYVDRALKATHRALRDQRWDQGY